MLTAVGVGAVRELDSRLSPLEDGPEHLPARLDEAPADLRELRCLL